MVLKRFYNEKLAQASYLIGCPACGEAIVIDPNRDAEQYIEAAKKEGVRITGVTETHIHADYLSGSRELAKMTGATLYLSDEGDADWKYAFAKLDGAVMLHAGDSIRAGAVRLDVVKTAGHTPEHISFLITDEGASKEPMGLFTGDFIFVGDVGRPDLLETAAGIEGTMETSARTLFRSIRAVDSLPNHLLVWPGHGAGSACGKALGAVPVSSLGYERVSNWALRSANEEAFVNEVLSGQPDPPAYFAMMKRLNKEGPPILGGFPEPTRLENASELTSAMEGGALLVDVRTSEDFQRGFAKGSINIPRYRNFITYAGSALPYDRDLILLAPDDATVRETVYDLAMIGLDRVRAWVGPEVLSGMGKLDTILPLIGRDLLPLPADAVVLDIRNRSEREAGAIEGTAHIPYPALQKRLDELPRDKRIIVHCQTGARSATAASLLKRAGFVDVADVTDGFVGYTEAKRGGLRVMAH